MPSGIEYRRRRYWQRKAWLNMVKLERGCDRCGYRVSPAALEWDHRPGEIKSFQINNSWSRSREALLDEMAKCDLLCANCHREETAERRSLANPRAASVREVPAPEEAA